MDSFVEGIMNLIFQSFIDTLYDIIGIIVSLVIIIAVLFAIHYIYKNRFKIFEKEDDRMKRELSETRKRKEQINSK
ncbi:FeoB-associated Cys-rich membrane protein [Methanococcus voltae]|uniref:Uncharacterized protein n=1 Tax=Methanococcus voltae (strain ATCC BAA-1334 / A3) TaxID=456320 RepID=D7DR45_METV3|nr:FeoB-associated Cys-rich membrane protein [Methanococcus voltae]MCS3900982.1 uncharacterized protein YxeA [Methanococcus voltae]